MNTLLYGENVLLAATGMFVVGFLFIGWDKDIWCPPYLFRVWASAKSEGSMHCAILSKMTQGRCDSSSVSAKFQGLRVNYRHRSRPGSAMLLRLNVDSWLKLVQGSRINLQPIKCWFSCLALTDAHLIGCSCHCS